MNALSDDFGDITTERMVQQVFAEVTRYPEEILDVEADLESDLGIDSVKLGEVFSVLRERFALPEQIDAPREQLRTIGGIANAVGRYQRASAGDVLAAAATQETDPVGNERNLVKAAPDRDIVNEVRAVFAEVTRYPEEILDPSADLEADLGIDSVKLGEVFSVLRERFGLPEILDIPREQLRTIEGVAGAIQGFQRGVTESRTAPIDERVVVDNAPPPKQSEFARPTVTAKQSQARARDDVAPGALPLAGKVALVTGSGRGIGKDVATHLAELGARVVVNSFHSRQAGEAAVQEICERGGDATYIWASTANPDQIDDLFTQIEERYGGLDFLVANASNGMLARLEDITPDDWEKAFRTNVVGLHKCAMRAAELMRRRGGGKIITLSSPASHGYVEYFGCMGAVKAAVESLTRSLAIELAPDNIQVNCVSPGPTYGELLNKWPDSERLIAQWERKTAYSRLCEAPDVSHFIAYLLGERVKMFNGSVLVMDGGISISSF